MANNNIEEEDDSVEKTRKLNILVYGLDRTELTAPAKPIAKKNFTINFERFKTAKRLCDYDAVIVFQETFERFKYVEPNYESPYWTHSYDSDELDRRKKELALLLSRGGCACYLIAEIFTDVVERKDTSRTDLAKFRLHFSGIKYSNLERRLTTTTFIADEFRRFINFYGATSIRFSWNEIETDVRLITTFNNSINAGIVVDRNEYFVPTLIPQNEPSIVEEYFVLLADALTAHFNKIRSALPSWVEMLQFHGETELRANLVEYEAKVSAINQKLVTFNRFKLTLIRSNDDLVDEVVHLFTQGFQIKVSRVEQFREDIKLLDDSDVPFCICEVKGLNRSVSREHLNQTDTHREACGMNPGFPAILIANTSIKNSTSLEQKDQEVAVEQIRHAVNQSVLIVRTIDLLKLFKLLEMGKVDRAHVITLLKTKTGWLHVTNDEVCIETGNNET